MNDQLLPAIRRLADRYGLPDGLSLFEDPGWIWLAAFAARCDDYQDWLNSLTPNPAQSRAPKASVN